MDWLLCCFTVQFAFVKKKKNYTTWNSLLCQWSACCTFQVSVNMQPHNFRKCFGYWTKSQKDSHETLASNSRSTKHLLHFQMTSNCILQEGKITKGHSCLHINSFTHTTILKLTLHRSYLVYFLWWLYHYQKENIDKTLLSYSSLLHITTIVQLFFCNLNIKLRTCRLQQTIQFSISTYLWVVNSTCIV